MTTTQSNITVRINRLRTLLAWLEDNAHTLPDGWVLLGPDGRYPCLSWCDHSTSADDTVDGRAVVARLTESLGAPTWGWSKPYWGGHADADWYVPLGDRLLRLTVYGVGETATPAADKESAAQ